jgi:hypothetical protein
MREQQHHAHRRSARVAQKRMYRARVARCHTHSPLFSHGPVRARANKPCGGRAHTAARARRLSAAAYHAIYGRAILHEQWLLAALAAVRPAQRCAAAPRAGGAAVLPGRPYDSAASRQTAAAQHPHTAWRHPSPSESATGGVTGDSQSFTDPATPSPFRTSRSPMRRSIARPLRRQSGWTVQWASRSDARLHRARQH